MPERDSHSRLHPRGNLAGSAMNAATRPFIADNRSRNDLGESLLEQDELNGSNVATPEIDRVQDELMTESSPDGRPPERRLRRSEWKWFALGAACFIAFIIFGLVWIAVSLNLPPIMIVLGVLLIIVVGAATSPSWGAGLLRRDEQREARKEALTQDHSSHRP